MYDDQANCVLICSLFISLLPCVIFPLTQRLQRTREFAREECLVVTPGRPCDGEEAGASTSRTPRRTPGRAATPRHTPRSAATPGRTPGSRGRRTPEAGVRGVKTGGGRRQLVRMAALRSPFASPNTQNQRMWVFCYSFRPCSSDFILCLLLLFSVGFSALSVCFSALTESLTEIWSRCPVGSGG